ncbi:MAG: helix-hairpin-helix domain-containing protein [Candidatus Accumulibacter sp. UW26]|jgi:competence protein ComEA
MHKLITLLVALLMVSLNAFAAVNVNTASEAELQTLAGIGPAKAKAIIDYRDKNGAFKAVDDLTKVPGIGAGVLSKIRSEVTLTGSTTPAAPANKMATPAAAPANKMATPAPAPANKMAMPVVSEPAKPAMPAPPAAPATPR